MRTLFITGTDTGVGKTLCSALLCAHLAKKGKTVYIKAVQTGDVLDAEFIQSVCGDSVPVFCTTHLKLPASPHLAAAEEGTKVQVSEVVDKISGIATKESPDFLVVEGAGGISVPFNDTENMVDLCKAINAEPIVVTRSGLGTLNHTFLTLNYAQSCGLEASVIISGCHENPDRVEEDNLDQIKQMSSDRVIGYVPFYEGADTEEIQFSGEIPEFDI